MILGRNVFEVQCKAAAKSAGVGNVMAVAHAIRARLFDRGLIRQNNILQRNYMLEPSVMQESGLSCDINYRTPLR